MVSRETNKETSRKRIRLKWRLRQSKKGGEEGNKKQDLDSDLLREAMAAYYFYLYHRLTRGNPLVNPPAGSRTEPESGGPLFPCFSLSEGPEGIRTQ